MRTRSSRGADQGGGPVAKIETGTYIPLPLEPRGLFRVEQRGVAEGMFPPGPWRVVAAYATLAEAEEHPPADWAEQRVVPDADEVEALRVRAQQQLAYIRELEDEVADYSPLREVTAAARARAAEAFAAWLVRWDK